MSKAKDILENIINDFSADKFTNLFREKNQKFEPHKTALEEYNDEDFDNGLIIGKIDFEDGELLICAFLVNGRLSEKSGKKKQYEKGKKILKNTQSDAGIFIFYDQSGSFRFSLIYANYQGTHRDWSLFKRFTYYADKSFTNKTFLQRIGESNFSSIANIKEAFSVEKVTKEFYEDIANWYFWAIEHCNFPKNVEEEENGRNVAVIRLITRMIFVWFMRERGLIPQKLFEKDNISLILNNTESNNSTYYKAILQNLFFATLSTKKEERQFRDEKRFNRGWNKDFGNQYVYRFQDFFVTPEKIEDYFGEIPFLNGGLFECLDDGRNDVYVDGFTERKEEYQPVIPNFLFFSDDKKTDLNSYYGTKNKIYKVQGLLNILSSFNFTIDENSPDDADVALDPELLGKVFENLLASFNPETSTTARKSTGSYYTPREIVDYMVTESLKEYFRNHLSEVKNINEKIEKLFFTQNNENPFDNSESKKIVELVENLRIVDPAVGSGAFPMGVLNKMVFILNKVDPENELWKQEQLKATDFIPDPKVRNFTKNQIEEFFKYKNADYGRKLYLIQKCIYGVDIQQIAVEIAKLRFFISLLVDEKIDKEKPNWDIQPLPNLDFKIIQGDSLISEFLGIDFDNYKEQKESSVTEFEFAAKDKILIKEFEQKKIDFQNEPEKDKKISLKNEIESLMIKIFETKIEERSADYFCQIKEIEKKYALLPDKKIREEKIINEKQKLSQKTGFDFENVKKQLYEYTHKNKIKPFFPWKLYFAEVFERGGFDIVIANPPYVRQEKIICKTALQKEYDIFNSVSDFYTYFYERGLSLLKKRGTLAFITSNKFLRARYGIYLRRYLKTNTSIKSIINFGNQHVFEAVTNTLIFIATKRKIKDSTFNYSDIIDEPNKIKFQQNELQDSEWTIENPKVMHLKDKIEKIGNPLKDWNVNIYLGIKIGFNDAFIINTDKKNEILENCETEDERIITKEFIKPVLRGRDINKYSYRWAEQWIILIKSGWTKELMESNGLNPEDFFKSTCPAIYNHLISFVNEKGKGRGLINRTDKGDYWWELRDCAYYEEFEKEKIIWIELTSKNKFTYSDKENYLLAGAFFMVGDSLKYLLSFLNSKLCLFYFSLICNSSGMATIQWKKFALEKVPIKKLSEADQKPFIDLVDKILDITKDDGHLQDPDKLDKIRKYERQIDEMVYELYGLMEEEIDIIENTHN